jgi:hypothetical protein
MAYSVGQLLSMQVASRLAGVAALLMVQRMCMLRTQLSHDTCVAGLAACLMGLAAPRATAVCVGCICRRHSSPDTALRPAGCWPGGPARADPLAWALLMLFVCSMQLLQKPDSQLQL